MLREIDQQVGLAHAWAESGGYPVADIVQDVRAFDPTSIALIARGTSDNAASYAKYLLEIMGGYLVSSTSPSTMTLYGARPRPSRSLCIAVSQSGRSPDLVKTLESFHSAGSLCIAVTNDPDSPLAAQADHVIDLGAGIEQAVAATKTFTCELLALLDLASGICNVPTVDRPALAEAISDAASPSLATAITDATAVLAPAMQAAGHLLVISRGASTPIAHEGALKIMETVGLPALSYSTADLEHGPIAYVGRRTPILVIDSIGPAAKSLETVVTRLIDLGAEIVQVGSASSVPGVRVHMPIRDLAPLISPIAEAVPLQRLAHRLAIDVGRNPDRPTGLSKVTLTQ